MGENILKRKKIRKEKTLWKENLSVNDKWEKKTKGTSSLSFGCKLIVTYENFEKDE